MTSHQDYYTEIAGVEVRFNVEYDFSPGCAAVMYLSNGDPGYPAEPPEIEITSIDYVEEVDGKEVYTKVPDWLLKVLVQSDYLYNHLMENHDEGEEPDWEDRYEDDARLNREEYYYDGE